ncbi:hypothetical protein TruAng_003807 [Truncatella angustata]|nr:hypothetical protein TruAng_003807 [Truncatella angustata]
MQLAATLLLLSPALAFTGRMTHYDPGLGACGRTNGPNDRIVALGHSRFTAGNPNNDPLCGKNIKIHHNGVTVTAQAVDKCMSCGANDIDVSPAVFKFFAPLGTGVMQVEWEFA